MSWRVLGRLRKETGGAVAPTVALSLVALIAVGGIAFDYARMAAMDTELQNAADQAALAAASQLDGTSTAITRATNAANNLILNGTLFANDGNASNTKVTIASLIFYSVYNPDTDTGTTTTDATAAKFVEVTVGSRKAFFALTPIVSALSSGDIGAKAIAGLGAAVCNVPPLMICGPSADFPTTSDIGKGLLLQPGSGTDPGAWAPGDYGYLDFGNGASGLATNLGANSDDAACHEATNGIETEPGDKASVTKALNTRFDIYAPSAPACDAASGDYCPAENTGKDLVIKEVTKVDGTSGVVPARPACSGAAGDFELNTSARGFTRDTCHIDGSCSTSHFGDGDWDIDAYFTANHSGILPAVVGGSTRYSVYQWELLDKTNRLKSRIVNPSDAPEFKEKGKSGNGEYTFTNYCAYPQPVNGTAVAKTTTQKDRRLLTVASVDCSNLNGKKAVPVIRWFDVFLVEPSLNRTTPYSTGQDEIYVEVVGPATKPDGANAFQFYSRNKPYLIK